MKYLFFLLLALPSFVLAEESSSDLGTEVPVAPAAEAPAFPKVYKEKFILGLQTVDFDYKEPGLMSDRGWLTGLNFQYHRPISSYDSLKASLDYVQGSTAYDGALQTNTGVSTPYSSTQQFRVINLEVLLASPLFNSSTWGMTIGGGYRNTNDSKTGQYDYRRNITYYYLLAGVNTSVYTNGKINSVGSFEISSLLGGGAKTYLSDVSTSYKDVNFAFQYGTAVKLGLETTLPIFTDKEVIVDLTYKYWTLTDSKTEYVGNGHYGLEPHNTTGLTSITIGYVF
jgi:hypothetical protein